MLVTQIDPQLCVYTIDGVLSPEECETLIQRTETIGYESAPISTGAGFIMAPEIRNNTRVMIDDVAAADRLFERVREHLPPFWGDWIVQGLNERFRFYRYDPGQAFRWHADGSYVRSPEEKSMLTFMIYLNDGFKGGETDFQGLPSAEPKQGRALVFHHPLWHQGAELIEGRKYVIRSDVMYRRPPYGLGE